MFTLVISTFRENSGGNLVDLSSFWSTGVAIFAVGRGAVEDEGKAAREMLCGCARAVKVYCHLIKAVGKWSRNG